MSLAIPRPLTFALCLTALGAGFLFGAWFSFPALDAYPILPGKLEGSTCMTQAAVLRGQSDSVRVPDGALDELIGQRDALREELKQWIGTQRSFPDSSGPDWFEELLIEWTTLVEGRELISLDCSEDPCIALLKLADGETETLLNAGPTALTELADGATLPWVHISQFGLEANDHLQLAISEDDTGSLARLNHRLERGMKDWLLQDAGRAADSIDLAEPPLRPPR